MYSEFLSHSVKFGKLIVQSKYKVFIDLIDFINNSEAAHYSRHDDLMFSFLTCYTDREENLDYQLLHYKAMADIGMLKAKGTLLLKVL